MHHKSHGKYKTIVKEKLSVSFSTKEATPTKEVVDKDILQVLAVNPVEGVPEAPPAVM